MSVSLVENVFKAKSCETYHELKYIRQQLCAQFTDECSRWRVVNTVSRFDRRITCVEWHGRYPHMVSFGSYSGDLYLLDTNNNKNDLFIKGVGCGYGSITQMAFCPSQPLHMYTSSLDGTFGKKDFEGRHGEIYLNTMDYRCWWTSFGISQNKMFVGGNTGNGVLLDSAGHTLHTYRRFHKAKIQHAEFCPASENIMVTCSNDKTVAIWDLRTWSDSDRPNPIATLDHQSPINSAYFDPIYGSRLLTTTQNSQLRVYDAHNWNTPTLTISHPHRNFQHMTHIKATWHPLYEDLCVVGRYAEKNDPDKTRCVDIIDLKQGVVAGQFFDPAVSQIMTVNKFNKFGTMLATGMGSNALVWSREGLPNDMKSSHSYLPIARQSESQRRKRKAKELK